MQVAVYLTDPVKHENGRAAHDHAARTSDAVGDGRVLRTRTTACERFDKLFANQKVFLENVDCEEAIPTSLRVNLADAVAVRSRSRRRWRASPNGTTTRSTCTEPGVRDVADYRDAARPARSRSRACSRSASSSIAVIMLASAIALVANTLRMGMFARRKEIGIMRLVGATNWRIRVPFLIEGLVEALLGAPGRDLRACS